MRFTFPHHTAKAKKKATTLRPLLRIAITLVSAIFCVAVSLSQNSSTAAPDRSAILQFLDQTINWYRQIDVERQIATEPNDIIAVNDNRPLADQIVRSAFDSARAAADLAAKSNQAQNPEGARYQSLRDLAAKLHQQIQQTQAELRSDRQKLEHSTGKKRQELEATIGELQSEIDLANARRDIIRNMADFVEGSSGALGASNLRGQIDALARTVPAEVSGTTNGASSNPSGNPPSRPAAVVSASKPEPSGIWGLTADLFSLSGKVHTISDRIKATDSRARANQQLLDPLVARLKELTQQSDAIAQQADAADPNTLAQQKKELDSLTAQFKQVSAAVLPLSKQSILLDLYKRGLMNWQGSVKAQYRSDLRGLLIRLLLLAAALGFVLGAAELWRRASFRYVQA